MITVINVKRIFLTFQSPETPVWLLMRHRDEDAQKSLCKLRGWTTPDNVKEEFDDLSNYSKKLQNCVICSGIEQNVKTCPHSSMNWFKR